MSVHKGASRLRNGETLKDRPRTGRPRVVKTETIRKAFENDLTFKISKCNRTLEQPGMCEDLQYLRQNLFDGICVSNMYINYSTSICYSLFVRKLIYTDLYYLIILM